ncbi:MAG: lactate racemase domain-containing protein, partial [Desulfobacterales bacterium]|nr:lactate racemase domain-containing protein [Desulfobacterales bacterium]
MPSAIARLLEGIPVPRLVKVQQVFERLAITDVAAVLRKRLLDSRVLGSVRPGISIGVGVGSRGISNQPMMVRILIDHLKAKGSHPFIFPAMGSHGGATAEGQQDLLARMGISEQTMGAPVRATMDVVDMGTAENGLTAWFDAYAAAADGIVLINRIKPHVSFRGRYESGLMKMIAIGLGKQKGAEVCHQLGMERMLGNIEAIGRTALSTGKILFGIALLENGYHETCRIEVIPADRIEEEEVALQAEAKRLEPRILFDRLDVLIIDEIGKNISGTGFDNNVVGRYHLPHMTSAGPFITRIAALDITEASHGNGNGLGIVDFTTDRAYRKFNFEETYPNSLTSTVPASVKIPMVLKNDRLAIQAAIKTCNIADFRQVRLGRIKNTLEVHQMEISQ